MESEGLDVQQDTIKVVINDLGIRKSFSQKRELTEDTWMTGFRIKSGSIPKEKGEAFGRIK
jgi:hypothetical protein